MRNKIIFAFSIPKNNASFRVKVWRKLKQLKSDNYHGTFWILKYSEKNIKELKNLSREITKNGGKVSVLEGTILWKK